MSRRCKAGKRARIIDGHARDIGKIVLVVKAYYYPAVVAGGVWPLAMFGWEVVSLCGPLYAEEVQTGAEIPPSVSGVYEDESLEPIDDDEDPQEDTDEGVDEDQRKHAIA